VGRIRYLPMIHHRFLRTRSFRTGFDESRELLGRLYDGIANAAPGRLIVDSSKVPSSAHLLSTLPRVRAAYVHLVRDSRAVAYSQQRERVRPDIHWTRETMNRLPPFKSA